MKESHLSRRNFVKASSLVSLSAATALSGCSGGGGGPSVKVTSNELSDSLKVTDSTLKNNKVLGTKAITMTLTVKNKTDSKVTAEFDATFLDGDTIVGKDKEGQYVGKDFPPNTKKEVSGAIKGRLSDITRVEVKIKKNSLM